MASEQDLDGFSQHNIDQIPFVFNNKSSRSHMRHFLGVSDHQPQHPGFQAETQHSRFVPPEADSRNSKFRSDGPVLTTTNMQKSNSHSANYSGFYPTSSHELSQREPVIPFNFVPSNFSRERPNCVESISGHSVLPQNFNQFGQIFAKLAGNREDPSNHGLNREIGEENLRPVFGPSTANFLMPHRSRSINDSRLDSGPQNLPPSVGYSSLQDPGFRSSGNYRPMIPKISDQEIFSRPFNKK